MNKFLRQSLAVDAQELTASNVSTAMCTMSNVLVINPINKSTHQRMNDETKKILHLLINSVGIETSLVIGSNFSCAKMVSESMDYTYDLLVNAIRWKKDLNDGAFCELSYLDGFKKSLCAHILSDVPDKNYENIKNGIVKFLEESKAIVLQCKELGMPVDDDIDEAYTYSNEALDALATYLAN